MTRGEHHLVSSLGPNAPERASDATGADDANLHLLAVRRHGNTCSERDEAEGGCDAGHFEQIATTMIRLAAYSHLGLQNREQREFMGES